MNLLTLDHLVMSCETLEEGQAAAETAFGVPLTHGGEHSEFGTHNSLLSLGETYYFEVIAIDPKAPAPSRARWFNLDNFAGKPRLTNWAVKTPDLDAALAQLPAGFGEPVSLRRGEFNWRMAVPDSGLLAFEGFAPAIIEWQGPLHPAPKLPDQGVRLKSFRVQHPEAEKMARLLAPLMPRDTTLFEPSETLGLRAIFQTPAGEIRLS